MKEKFQKFISILFLIVLFGFNNQINLTETSNFHHSEVFKQNQALSYDFDNFTHFRSIYNSANESEKSVVISDYISWQETTGEGFPAIQNHTYVVFIYYTPALIIDSCGIVGDFTAWNIRNMTRLDDDISFFYYEYSFEPTSRIDYFYVVEDELILDERNPQTAPAGFDFPASELTMPEFVQPEEIVYREGIDHGNLEALEYPWSNPFVQVYLPPNYDTNRQYPVVYVGDGSSYTDLMFMTNIIDNLVADKRISPVIAVFIDPIDFVPGEPYDVMKRINWYKCNPDYLEYLDNLVTHIDLMYSTNKSAHARCHLGLSLSGLVSTYVAFERPNLFKLFASQSGSFRIGEEIFSIKTKYDLVAENLDFKAWFSIGTYENNNNFGTLMVEDTEEMASICERKGWPTKLVYSVGECHSYGQWRHCLDDMLEFFFPYEEYNPTEETKINILLFVIPTIVLILINQKKCSKRKIDNFS